MKQYVKIILIVLLCIWSFMVYAGTIEGTLVFDEGKISITKQAGYDMIEYDDANAYYEYIAGTPFLPVYSCKVLIPADAVNVTLDIISEDVRMIADGITCYPTQQVKIISMPDDTKTPADPAVYTTDALYPAGESMVICNDSQIRGYNILNLKVKPVKLNPVKKELYLVTNMAYKITYDLDPAVVRSSYPYNRVFDEMIKENVVNGEHARFFYGSTYREPLRAPVDMLLITNDVLKPVFTDYAANRAAYEGHTYKVISVSEIDTLYTGATQQLRIKNCIYDYTLNNNTTYIILGGDTPVVPDQDVYGDIGGTFVDNTIPCDTFYVCFDKQFDWNANGNDKLGEPDDNADVAPDAIIGRISVRDAGQVNDYLTKVNRYLNATKSDREFVKKVLLTGVKLWHPGDAAVKSDAMYDNYIKNNWVGNKKITCYDSDPGVTLTTSSFSAKINQGVNIMHMATHGTYTDWSMETGGKFAVTHADALRSHVQGTVVTIACQSNGFDQEPCLGEAFVRNPNGGSIIYIGASRYGLGDSDGTAEHGPSFTYNREYFNAILTSANNNSGAAFMQAKNILAPQTDHKYMRWVHYCLNFLGDPTINMAKDLKVITPTPTETPIPVTPTPYYINVALNKPVTASGVFSSQFSAPSINDGNPATAWGSAYNKGNQWVFIDLQKETAIDTVVIKYFNPYYSPYYHVGISHDAVTWEFASTITNGDGDVDTVAIGRNARYVGLYLTKGAKLAYGIKELEIYEKRYPPTPTMTPTPTPTATTTPPPTPPPYDFWEVGVPYAVGDKVFYNDNVWRCTSVHTSSAMWYPGAPGVYFWRLDN